MPNPLHPADTNTSLWKQTTVLRNAQGQEEAISVGPDGNVWSFIADSGDSRFDASGQRLESRMPADFVTLGLHAAGALVVDRSQGLAPSVPHGDPVDRIGHGSNGLSHRWTPAKPVRTARGDPLGAVGVRRSYTQNDFSGTGAWP